jgi:hypothetical protein
VLTFENPEGADCYAWFLSSPRLPSPFLILIHLVGQEEQEQHIFRGDFGGDFFITPSPLYWLIPVF